ncbi:MAG: hypothetical protein ACYS6K_05965 [Planctomycetota bacterium]|jgi:hypothetical protein
MKRENYFAIVNKDHQEVVCVSNSNEVLLFRSQREATEFRETLLLEDTSIGMAPLAFFLDAGLKPRIFNGYPPLIVVAN